MKARAHSRLKCAPCESYVYVCVFCFQCVHEWVPFAENEWTSPGSHMFMDDVGIHHVRLRAMLTSNIGQMQATTQHWCHTCEIVQLLAAINPTSHATPWPRILRLCVGHVRCVIDTHGISTQRPTRALVLTRARSRSYWLRPIPHPAQHLGRAPYPALFLEPCGKFSVFSTYSLSCFLRATAVREIAWACSRKRSACVARGGDHHVARRLQRRTHLQTQRWPRIG
jgi:hypothetical protein